MTHISTLGMGYKLTITPPYLEKKTKIAYLDSIGTHNDINIVLGNGFGLCITRSQLENKLTLDISI